MASKTDKELRKEIAYLTNLIASHKKATSVPQYKPNLPSVQSGRPNVFKWTATSVPVLQKHTSTKPVALLNTTHGPQPSLQPTHTTTHGPQPSLQPTHTTTHGPQPSLQPTHTTTHGPQPSLQPTHTTTHGPQPSLQPTHTTTHGPQPSLQPTHTTTHSSQPSLQPTHTTTHSSQPSLQPTHTTSAESTPASSTVLPHNDTLPPNKPSNNNLYHYSSRHHHGNNHHHGNPLHHHGNPRPGSRKRIWSNLVYSPSIQKDTDCKASTTLASSSAKKPTASSTRHLNPSAGKTKVGNKEGGIRKRLSSAKSPPGGGPETHHTTHPPTQSESVPALKGRPASTPQCQGGKSTAKMESRSPHCSGDTLSASYAGSDSTLRDPGEASASALPGKACRSHNRLKWSRDRSGAKAPGVAQHPEHHHHGASATSSNEVTTPILRCSYSHVNRRRLGSGSASGSRYKWRRHHTTSSFTSSKTSLTLKSKSPAPRARPHTPSWIVHNKYKLTHASIVHKYSKIMHRQRISNSGISKLSRSIARRAQPQALRKSRPTARNRVWRASDAKDNNGNDAKLTTPSRRLSGHELKTRQGNRQWVAKRVKVNNHRFQLMPSTSRSSCSGHKSSPISSTHPLRRLSGHELKTRRGNKQWVSRHVMRRTPMSVNYHRGIAHSGMLVNRQRGRGRRNLFSPQLILLSGQKFVVDSGGRRMKKLSLSSSFSSSASPLLHRARLRSSIRSVSEMSQPTVKQYLASRAVQRSRVYVWSAKQRKRKQQTKQYCIFYNRFGKCNRGDACSYIHDPDKIAVCTRFLRGMCDKTDGSCLFSHTISKNKMPTCSYFLRGVCSRDVCPYLHVSVGRRAKVCLDFARGYCPNGEQCTKQHVIDCPDYSNQGSCPRGRKCLLRHKKMFPKKRPERQPVAPTKTPLAFKRLHRKPVLKLRIGQAVEDGDDEVSHDEGDESCDSSPDDQQLRYSPLDPTCPAPDFLAL